jgi:hypothetical protein
MLTIRYPLSPLIDARRRVVEPQWLCPDQSVAAKGLITSGDAPVLTAPRFQWTLGRGWLSAHALSVAE